MEAITSTTWNPPRPGRFCCLCPSTAHPRLSALTALGSQLVRAHAKLSGIFHISSSELAPMRVFTPWTSASTASQSFRLPSRCLSAFTSAPLVVCSEVSPLAGALPEALQSSPHSCACRKGPVSVEGEMPTECFSCLLLVMNHPQHQGKAATTLLYYPVGQDIR